MRAVSLSEKACETRPMSDANTVLVEACDDKNTKGVKAALADGADVNAKDVEDTPALILAIRSKGKPAVKLLIAEGADPNAADDDGVTPLGAMAESLRDTALAALLIEKGADPSKGDPPPLHVAVQAAKRDFAEYLLDHGVDIDSRDDEEMTPLMVLCKSQGGEMNKAENANARWLLERGADVSLLDDGDTTALHYAVASAKVDFVKLLVEGGATISRTRVNNYTPMHFCMETRFRDTAIWDLLLEMGNPVETEGGNSLLHSATSNGNLIAVKYLLDHGADLDAKNAQGETALDQAEKYNKEKIAKVLKAWKAKA